MIEGGTRNSKEGMERGEKVEFLTRPHSGVRSNSTKETKKKGATLPKGVVSSRQTVAFRVILKTESVGRHVDARRKAKRNLAVGSRKGK